MAASFIQALVIETNNSVLFNQDGSLGELQAIPTPGNGARIDGDFWAKPITDGVVGTGFNYEPTTPDSTVKPDAQAFHVVKISMNNSSDYWYLRGVSTSTTALNYGYIQAAQDAECCDDTPRTMPTDVPNLAGCQFVCETNDDGNYVAYFGIPSLQAPYTRYFPYGYLNGVALANAAATGYSTINAMLTFLNASWNVGGGSPAATNVWSFAQDGLTLVLTQTNGTGDDYICVQVAAINPSDPLI